MPSQPMEGLSFTIRHGELIWQAAAGLFAAVGVALPRIRLRRRWHRTRAGALEALGEATLPEAGEDAVLEGTLEAEEPVDVLGARVAAASLVAEGGDDEPRATVHDVRAGRLVLATDEGRFRLDGPVEVRAGSWERWTGRPLLASKLHTATGMESPVSLNLKAGLRAITPGARVRMRGRVTQVAEPSSEREGDYRQAATRWVVSGEEAPIVLVARHGHRLEGPGWPARVAMVLFAALAFVTLFGVAGLWAEELEAAQVAAATPFHREDGLRMERRRLEEAVAEDPTAVAPFVELSQMLGDGPRPIFTLVRHGYLDEAEPIARAHGSFHDLTRIAGEWAARGRFSRASDAGLAAMARMLEEPEGIYGFVLSHDIVPVHLFAQRFDRAAEAMGHAVELEALDPIDDDPETRAYEVEKRAKQRCYAAYLQHLAGDAAASARLSELREGPARPYCTHVHALSRPPAERAQAIVACDACSESPLPPLLLNLLTYEGLGCAGTGDDPRCESAARQIHDERLRYVQAEHMVLDPSSWLYRFQPGVARRLLEQLRGHDEPVPHQRVVRVALATTQGVWFAMTGAFEEATSAFDAALADREALAAAAREREDAAAEDEGGEGPTSIDHGALRDQLFSLRAMKAVLLRDWDGARRHLAERTRPAPVHTSLIRVLDPGAPLPDDLEGPLWGHVSAERRPAIAAALRGRGDPAKLEFISHRAQVLLSTRLGAKVPYPDPHFVVTGLRSTLYSAVPALHLAWLRGDAELAERTGALVDAVRAAAFAPQITEALLAQP